MKIHEWGLLIALVSGTVYNVDNTLIRMILMLLWAFVPILFLLKFNKQNIGFNGIKELSYSLIILLLLFISFLVNIDTLSFELSGPNVEKLTPFLYFFHVTTLFYFLQLNSKKINSRFVTYFMISIVIILFLDMIVRYIQAPQYFLNYDTRHQAKTIGFFSTTNVNGQIIAFFIVMSWGIRFQFKKLIQFLMIGILITTMARSAIVAIIAVYVFKYLLHTKGFISRSISIVLAVGIIVLFIIDPMNFQSDGSLLSKLQFFNATYNLILTGSIGDIVFGYGASYDAITTALDVRGWSPHVSILKAFLYYGLFGVFIFIFILIHFVKENKKMFLPIITFLIFSLAGAPIFWPTLSVGLIILMIYDNIERNKINVNKQFK